MYRDELLAQASQLEYLGQDLANFKKEAHLHPRPELVAQVAGVLGSDGLLPVLIGESGVGKTSIIQCLAREMASASPNVPQSLHGHRIIHLSATDLLAQAIFANQMEHKISLIKSNCIAGRAILLLDDMSQFVGSGSSIDTPETDVLSLFTPFVQRGLLKVIGCTTPAGWRLVSLRRPLLARIGVTIGVQELKSVETHMILARRATSYRSRGLRVTDKAIAETMILGDRLYPWKRQPGKACDLLETIVATHLIGRSSELTPDDGSLFPPTPNIAVIERRHVLDNLRRLTNLPEFLLDPLKPRSRGELLAFLGESVLGQPDVISPIVERIMLMQSRMCATDRPLGVFLLAGPSGVGKTLLARSVAKLLLGDEKRLVRFDMSEFTTAECVMRFVGGQKSMASRLGLVDAALSLPMPVILLDEIEKAHPQVFDTLLQVFGEARLSDQAGRIAHFSNTLFLMTSNLGTGKAAIDHPRAGGCDDSQPDQLRQAIRSHFRPEFINRLTATLSFRHLSESAQEEIARREVRRLEQRGGLQERKVNLRIRQAAICLLRERGYSHEYGARPMERVVESLVGGAVAAYLAQNPLVEDCTLLVDVRPGTEKLFVSDKVHIKYTAKPSSLSGSGVFRSEADLAA